MVLSLVGHETEIVKWYPGFMAFSYGMNHVFPFGRSDSDGDILQCSAESTLGVTLKMRQDHYEVIICKVGTYQVLRQIRAAIHRETYGPFFVHNVNCGNIVKAVIRNNLPMQSGFRARTAISGIALYDCSVHRLHKRLNQIGVKIIVVSRLASGQLYGYIARSGPSPSGTFQWSPSADGCPP